MMPFWEKLLYSSLAILSILTGLFFFFFGSKIEYVKNLGLTMGDFIAGLAGAFFALAAVFLIFFTLRLQQVELQETRNTIMFQQFESSYFNLLNLFMQTVNDMIVMDRGSTGKKTEPVRGNRVLYSLSTRVSKMIKKDHDKFYATVRNVFFDTDDFRENLPQFFNLIDRIIKYVNENKYIDKKKKADYYMTFSSIIPYPGKLIISALLHSHDKFYQSNIEIILNLYIVNDI